VHITNNGNVYGTYEILIHCVTLVSLNSRINMASSTIYIHATMAALQLMVWL